MQRIRSIDVLRGMVMIIMALDHIRDFWSVSGYSMQPVMDPGIPPEWYWTRWITHLCAPIFVLLAGTSARLWQVSRDASTSELSWFLFTRGLWLVAVEFLIVNPSWQFSYAFSFGQVIWAIGASMITLAVLVQLPRWAIATFGLLLVFGHNLFDQGGLVGPLVEWQGPMQTLPQWIWAFLHESRFGCLFGELGQRGCSSGQPYFVAYPLIPWLGVMALGYLFADLVREEGGLRRARNIGLGMLALFVLLRTFDLYGDPSHWMPDDQSLVASIQSFMNLTKYPPSLLFLLATIGIGLVLMPWMERAASSAGEGPLAVAGRRICAWVSVFGQVPFFYYVIHVPVIHLTSRLYFGWDNGSWYFSGLQGAPEGYEPELWLSYLVWAILVIAFYFPCRWYADLKRRHKDWKLLTYL